MKTILVLDDDATVLSFFRAVLTSKGYNVLQATTVEQAIWWRGKTAGIDLVIADVTLPGDSGVRAAARMKESFPAMKVVLTSGYPQEMWGTHHLFELENIPPEDVTILQKPFLPAAVRKCVAELIGGPSADVCGVMSGGA